MTASQMLSADTSWRLTCRSSWSIVLKPPLASLPVLEARIRRGVVIRCSPPWSHYPCLRHASEGVELHLRQVGSYYPRSSRASEQPVATLGHITRDSVAHPSSVIDEDAGITSCQGAIAVSTMRELGLRAAGWLGSARAESDFCGASSVSKAWRN